MTCFLVPTFNSHHWTNKPIQRYHSHFKRHSNLQNTLSSAIKMCFAKSTTYTDCPCTTAHLSKNIHFYPSSQTSVSIYGSWAFEEDSHQLIWRQSTARSRSAIVCALMWSRLRAWKRVLVRDPISLASLLQAELNGLNQMDATRKRYSLTLNLIFKYFTSSWFSLSIIRDTRQRRFRV